MPCTFVWELDDDEEEKLDENIWDDCGGDAGKGMLDLADFSAATLKFSEQSGLKDPGGSKVGMYDLESDATMEQLMSEQTKKSSTDSSSNDKSKLLLQSLGMGNGDKRAASSSDSGGSGGGIRVMSSQDQMYQLDTAKVQSIDATGDDDNFLEALIEEDIGNLQVDPSQVAIESLKIDSAVTLSPKQPHSRHGHDEEIDMSFKVDNFMQNVNQPPPAPEPNVVDAWYYKDPQQNVQGPFETSSMRRWLESGYFKENLPIKLKHWSKFYALGVAYTNPKLAFLKPIPEPNVHDLSVRDREASSQQHTNSQRSFMQQQQGPQQVRVQQGQPQQQHMQQEQAMQQPQQDQLRQQRMQQQEQQQQLQQAQLKQQRLQQQQLEQQRLQQQEQLEQQRLQQQQLEQQRLQQQQLEQQRLKNEQPKHSTGDKHGKQMEMKKEKPKVARELEQSDKVDETKITSSSAGKAQSAPVWGQSAVASKKSIAEIQKEEEKRVFEEGGDNNSKLLKSLLGVSGSTNSGNNGGKGWGVTTRGSPVSSSLREIQQEQKVVNNQEQAALMQKQQTEAKMRAQHGSGDVDLSFSSSQWKSPDSNVTDSGNENKAKSLVEIMNEEATSKDEGSVVRTSSSSWASRAANPNAPVHSQKRNVPVSQATSSSKSKVQNTTTVQHSQPTSTVPIPRNQREIVAGLAKNKDTKPVPSSKKETKTTNIASSTPKKTGDSLTDWAVDQLKNLNTKNKGSTDDLALIQFCLILESSIEIREYLAEYLGSTPEVSLFASEFIRRKEGKPASSSYASSMSSAVANSNSDRNNNAGFGVAGKKKNKKHNK